MNMKHSPTDTQVPSIVDVLENVLPVIIFWAPVLWLMMVVGIVVADVSAFLLLLTVSHDAQYIMAVITAYWLHSLMVTSPTMIPLTEASIGYIQTATTPFLRRMAGDGGRHKSQ